MAARRLANPFSGDVPRAVESTLSLPDEPLSCMAFNSRGTYLASGSAEGSLVVWDLATAAPALVVRGVHADAVTSLTWAPRRRGRVVCSTSGDGTVKLFDVERRRVVAWLDLSPVEVNGASVDPEDADACLVCLAAKPRKQARNGAAATLAVVGKESEGPAADETPWPRLCSFTAHPALKVVYRPPGPPPKDGWQKSSGCLLYTSPSPRD